MRAVAVVDGCYHQAVILARITADDGRTHITIATVGSQHLALQRVFEVAEFALVECKC